MEQEVVNTFIENCRYFREVVLNLTLSGDGDNLHDIKYSFDYVINYVKEKKLDLTVFGQDVLDDAIKAGDEISGFYDSIDKLEKAIREFCERQTERNNRVYNQ